VVIISLAAAMWLRVERIKAQGSSPVPGASQQSEEQQIEARRGHQALRPRLI
jgi:hypothetical protein